LPLPDALAGVDQPALAARHRVEPGPRRAPGRVVRRPRLGRARLGAVARPRRLRVPAARDAVIERTLAGRWDPRGGGAAHAGLASEVRNLMALRPRRPEPDRLAVAHWLARTGLRDGRTLHAGVRRLEPGTMLVFAGDAVSVRRFWAPRYAPPRVASREDAVA